MKVSLKQKDEKRTNLAKLLGPTPADQKKTSNKQLLSSSKIMEKSQSGWNNRLEPSLSEKNHMGQREPLKSNIKFKKILENFKGSKTSQETWMPKISTKTHKDPTVLDVGNIGENSKHKKLSVSREISNQKDLIRRDVCQNNVQNKDNVFSVNVISDMTEIAKSQNDSLTKSQTEIEPLGRNHTQSSFLAPVNKVSAADTIQRISNVSGRHLRTNSILASKIDDSELTLPLNRRVSLKESVMMKSLKYNIANSRDLRSSRAQLPNSDLQNQSTSMIRRQSSAMNLSTSDRSKSELSKLSEMKYYGGPKVQTTSRLWVEGNEPSTRKMLSKSTERLAQANKELSKGLKVSLSKKLTITNPITRRLDISQSTAQLHKSYFVDNIDTIKSGTAKKDRSTTNLALMRLSQDEGRVTKRLRIKTISKESYKEFVYTKIKTDDNFGMIDILIDRNRERKISMLKLHKYLSELYKQVLLTNLLIKNSRKENPIAKLEKVTLEAPYRDKSKLKTIMIDLDETLIHAEPAKADELYDYTFSLNRGMIGLRLRPYVIDFLEQVYRKFELVLYTASGEAYALKIKEFLDPEGKYFAGILHRKHCVYFKSTHIKSITAITNRDPNDVFVLDNSLYAFPFDHQHKILVKPFTDDPDDCELLKLLVFIRENMLNSSKNLPEVTSEKISCQDLLECMHINDLVELFKRHIHLKGQ